MDRLTKVAHVAQIVASVAGVTAVVLMVWFRLSPQPAQAPVESSPQTTAVVTNWVVPSILAACILLAAIFHFAAARISRKRPDAPAVPHVVIASPIDNEAVTWIHTVRGCVDPPNTTIQVLVFAGDGLWYLQTRRVDARGSTWSVESHLGNKEKPGGSYEIVAVLGAELTKETYRALPDGLIKSNTVRVHRPV